MKLNPISTIEAKLGTNPNGPVQAFFTETCYKHMDKYVPMRDGHLSDTVDIGTDYITYESPYAHYMYEGKVMGPNIPIKENGVIVRWISKKPKYYTGADINYSTAQHKYAGPHWDKRMVSAEMDRVVQEVQDYINRGGK